MSIPSFNQATLSETREEKLQRRQDEGRRADDRAIAKFRIRHMNDTKWREVFELLSSPACVVRQINIKFVDVDKFFPSSGRLTPLTHWCDGWLGPFEYRAIEWIEVPNDYVEKQGTPGTPMAMQRQEIAAFRGVLDSLGKLPIQDVEIGFRIVGYE